MPFLPRAITTATETVAFSIDTSKIRAGTPAGADKAGTDRRSIDTNDIQTSRIGNSLSLRWKRRHRLQPRRFHRSPPVWAPAPYGHQRHGRNGDRELAHHSLLC
jgi:hypothetical protein